MAKGDTFAASSIQDVSHNSRQIKKPVYRLTKTQAVDLKTLSKEVGCPKSSFQVLDGNCLNKEERHISRINSQHESKHLEKTSAEHLKTLSGGREKSKGSSIEKPSQGKSLSSKWQNLTSTLPAEQKDQSVNARKRKFETETTGRGHKEFKTKESCKTSSAFKHLLKQKEKDLVEKLCPRLENTEFKAKRKFYKDEAPALSKDSTSGSSANASNSVRTSSKNVKSVSDRTRDSLSSRKLEHPSTSSLSPNYKIPKMVQTKLADCEPGTNKAASSHLERRIEPSNLEALVSSSTAAMKQTHRCSDATLSHVSDRTQKKSSLSDQLPSTSHSATELWCDEVRKIKCLFRKGTIFLVLLHGSCCLTR